MTDLLESIDVSKYDETIKILDQVLVLRKEQIVLIHKLKYQTWVSKQSAIHNHKFWVERIDTKEAHKLFDEFLQIFREAFGKEWNRYSPLQRTYQFQDWIGFMGFRWLEEQKRIKSKK